MNRKIVGFDTWEGFPSVDEKDGKAESVQVGSLAVTDKYEEYLGNLMEVREKEGPISQLRRHEFVKGDASVKIQEYLDRHPETIIALAYFDFDIYEPAKKCLKAIMNHVTRSKVLAFDELNYEEFPGEALALKEVIGLGKYTLCHTPFSSQRAYLVID